MNDQVYEWLNDWMIEWSGSAGLWSLLQLTTICASRSPPHHNNNNMVPIAGPPDYDESPVNEAQASLSWSKLKTILSDPLQIYKEMLKFHLEETDSLVANIDDMVADALTDFPDDDKSDIVAYAARLAWSYITGDTRTGHVRYVIYNSPSFFLVTYHYCSIVKAYIMYHRQYKSAWDAKAVTTQTPSDIKSSLPINVGQKRKATRGKRCSFCLLFQPCSLSPFYSSPQLFQLVLLRPLVLKHQTPWEDHPLPCYNSSHVQLWASHLLTSGVGVHDGPREDHGKGWWSICICPCSKTPGHASALLSLCYQPGGFIRGESSRNCLICECSFLGTSIWFSPFLSVHICLCSSWFFALMRPCPWCLRASTLFLVKVCDLLILSISSSSPLCRRVLRCHAGHTQIHPDSDTHWWRLHANDNNPMLCPIWMLILLAECYPTTISYSGPLFLKVGKQGTVLETEPMSTSQFVCALTVDLQALGYSYWVMYGTHSFRCGSCQYRVKHKAWTVAMVAAWGGWSRLRLWPGFVTSTPLLIMLRAL